MRIITRPIVRWPGQLLGPGQRLSPPFTAGWTETMELLTKEARQLGAPEVVIQLALDESQIRLDGWPYAQAQTAHPGVIISVESKSQGPLSFPCDRFDGPQWRSRVHGWQANVRAVALAMEALRKVDRYGITRQGEQYVGWKAIGSGTPMGPADEPKMTLDEAARFLGGNTAQMLSRPELVKDAYRSLAREHHPDAGGDPDLFRKITDARDLLLEHA